jgi:hypothetical protein
VYLKRPVSVLKRRGGKKRKESDMFLLSDFPEGSTFPKV